MPRVLEGSLPVLRAMGDDEKVEVSVRTAADAKIEETEALLKRFEEPEAMYAGARDKARPRRAPGRLPLLSCSATRRAFCALSLSLG